MRWLVVAILVTVAAVAFNLGLLMRQLIGVGTPRSLQGRARALLACLWSLVTSPEWLWNAIRTLRQPFPSPDHLHAPCGDRRIDFTVTTTCATGC